ncbi:MAG: hypothetical protein DRO88_13525 [Promethearchaeia archaeon]|nr:MAG: hypothetical protein DRO88_13525 [Candidatus Lokiarchaeia archaeon]
MSERLSIIISKTLKQDIDELKKRMNLDQSTLIRKLLADATKEEKLNYAIQEYKNQKLSLGNAAEFANVCLWEFIDELQKRKIFIEFPSEEIDKEINKIQSGYYDQFI